MACVLTDIFFDARESVQRNPGTCGRGRGIPPPRFAGFERRTCRRFAGGRKGPGVPRRLAGAPRSGVATEPRGVSSRRRQKKAQAKNLDAPRALNVKQRPNSSCTSTAFGAMEAPLGAAGARARNSVDSSEWQALCDLEAELEAELAGEVTRSSERSGRKSAERDVTSSSWVSPGVSSGTPTRARASAERPASSRSSATASPSPGYRLRRQPHPSWAPSAPQTPATASSPGADRSGARR